MSTVHLTIVLSTRNSPSQHFYSNIATFLFKQDISIEGLDDLNAEQLAFEQADKGECFGEISANLRDIRELREARQLNMEKFDAFAMIHREEGQQSLVHLLNTDVIQNIREYA